MVGRFRDDERTVFRSGEGRICPSCRKAESSCSCRDKSSRPPPGDGIVRVKREVKGRRGKTATTISGVPLPQSELQTLTKALKKRCGSGGSCKDGVIEIQGDQRDTVVAVLEGMGYRVKRAGG